MQVKIRLCAFGKGYIQRVFIRNLDGDFAPGQGGRTADDMKKILKNKSGASMLVVLCCMLIITSLAAVILTGSFSVMQKSVKANSETQSYISAKAMSDVVEKELTDTSPPVTDGLRAKLKEQNLTAAADVGAVSRTLAMKAQLPNGGGECEIEMYLERTEISVETLRVRVTAEYKGQKSSIAKSYNKSSSYEEDGSWM